MIHRMSGGVKLREGKLHRSLQPSGHDGRVKPNRRPVEDQACQVPP